MANSLNEDLTGKVIVFREGTLKPEYPVLRHLFWVQGGFGAQAFTNGRMLAGQDLYDGENAGMGGYDVDRLATRQEIEALDTEWSRQYLALLDTPGE
jgi:hypothetical protein